MTDREAMQMALDALIDALDSQREELNEHINKYGERYRPKRIEYMKKAIENTKTARDALRAALAQGEQEPVAWMAPNGMVSHERIGHFKIPLYAAPQQREWQGLTDDERKEIFESMPGGMDGFLRTWGWLPFSKALEQKLKEKNT